MSSPMVGVYVKVPADCDVTYSYEVGGDVEILLGTLRDGYEIIFERAALARFVEVAQHALAAPVDPDRKQVLELTTVAAV